MKNKMKTVVCYAASVCALAALSSATAKAADVDNSVWTYRAVANVTTQVNIRAYGTTDSAIIGYLPKGASADLIEKGEEWSHVISNGVEGYIKNEYLAFGSKAEELAKVYGTYGVKTNWDGVHLFAAPNAAADILNTVESGSEFTILDDQGAWYLVQMDDVTAAYVPAEDVEKTIITERAIAVEPFAAAEGTTDGGEGSADASYMDSDAEAQNTSYGSSYTENTYTEDTYSGQSANGASSNYEDNTEQNAEDYTEAPAAPGAGEVSDTPASEESEETVTSASADDLNLLAAIIYCEAGNQSREGKVAVGAVVLNRVASVSFPNTIYDVIYQSGQFTPAYSGVLASALANGVPSDCVEAAQAALNGENPVGGALYFNTGSGRGIKIGAHQFY